MAWYLTLAGRQAVEATKLQFPQCVPLHSFTFHRSPEVKISLRAESLIVLPRLLQRVSELILFCRYPIADGEFHTLAYYLWNVSPVSMEHESGDAQGHALTVHCTYSAGELKFEGAASTTLSFDVPLPLE